MRLAARFTWWLAFGFIAGLCVYWIITDALEHGCMPRVSPRFSSGGR